MAKHLNWRSASKGPKPRDIYDPYGHIDQITVKLRDSNRDIRRSSRAAWPDSSLTEMSPRTALTGRSTYSVGSTGAASSHLF
jgi:hypothetical protein